MKEFFNKIYKKINDKVSEIRKDLYVHAFVSSIIYILLFNILIFVCPGYMAAVWSTFVTLIIGLVKEYVIDDKIRGSYADVADLNADLAGTIVGILITLPIWFY